MNLIIQRLMRFRREIVQLWYAFWHPLTPTYLKVLTILTTLYVISPIDLVADFIPVLGWIDDFIIVSFAVSWIVSRLPRVTQDPMPHDYAQTDTQEKTIEGKARRR
ncbi:hypothetical protein MXMO3_00490 [Maritalea myrionectae]|uniref:DUF1232 domain-containing protein n=1 Tax=Maritalea myrionectae TaxID=454601 RepID=A0A2R4MAY3_9HYPH|nr:YkvA family protein [Maritalea myrionectae]AVX03036.1 hypothetical protein MXMO3_00490 [Maritalea myrionectae]